MKEITFRSGVDVELEDHCGSDAMIVAAARVSIRGLGQHRELEEGDDKLIAFLMKNRHGSPFEHNCMIFSVRAPIFVYREHHRHRVGWSYNEESARYKELEPVFYLPERDRNIVQEGKPGHYVMVPGNDHQHGAVLKMHQRANELAYQNYQALLRTGISREVARGCLPVNIYSSMYATCNARSLMHFLSLRTSVDYATFPSKPQREIEMVAEAYEEIFARLFPVTYAAWDENGRVCP